MKLTPEELDRLEAMIEAGLAPAPPPTPPDIADREPSITMLIACRRRRLERR